MARRSPLEARLKSSLEGAKRSETGRSRKLLMWKGNAALKETG